MILQNMANFGLLVFCPEIISISLGLLVMIYILLQTFLFFILVIKICCYRHLRPCVEPVLDLKCFISFCGKEGDKKRKFMLVRKALCTRLFCWFVFLIAACVWVMAGLEKQYSSWPCRLALVLFSSLPFVFTLPT